MASDQFQEWRRWAKGLIGNSDVVGRIDGSVKMKEREKILARVRIVLMTPDVCHAWVMSNLANPIVKEFVKHLGLVVLDEAHTLEGIFGSNFAFLREHGMEALALPFRSARSRHKSPLSRREPSPRLPSEQAERHAASPEHWA